MLRHSVRPGRYDSALTKMCCSDMAQFFLSINFSLHLALFSTFQTFAFYQLLAVSHVDSYSLQYIQFMVHNVDDGRHGTPAYIKRLFLSDNK